MTNSRFLLIKIAESGLELSDIAKKLKISLHTLDLKIHNKRAFLVYEMQILCDLLGLTDSHERISIFFTKDVEVYSSLEVNSTSLT